VSTYVREPWGAIGYRVHSREEPPDTVLDPLRVDGWVADDEDIEDQPFGVSASSDLEDLGRYVSGYSMQVNPGDRLLALYGDLSSEDDRDEHAIRVVVHDWHDMGDAATWAKVYYYDPADVEEMQDEDGEWHFPPGEAPWILRRMEDGWEWDFWPPVVLELKAVLLKQISSSP